MTVNNLGELRNEDVHEHDVNVQHESLVMLIPWIHAVTFK
jgi:hypothetical protein